MSSSPFTASVSTTRVHPPMIGALLRMPWEVVRERMLDGLHERGFTDLVPAHLTVLQYPGPEGRRPSELAASVRVSKQALSYLLGQMEHLGYLTRVADSEDQRSRRVKLTARGRAVSQSILEIVREIEVEWETELGAAAFAQLRGLLTQLCAIALAPAAPPPARPS